MLHGEQTFVTIAIPTFNRASSYLPQALQSALDQTYPHIEIVVADNASTDRTEEVVKSFSDPRIRYFRHAENIGASRNFNFCVEQARGAFFLRFHDDDLIDQDFIETCLSGVDDKSKIGIIRTGVRIIDSHGNVITDKINSVGGFAFEDFILGWFEGKMWPYLCNTLFHTERLKEIGGFRSKHYLFDDVMAAMVLAARFGRVDIEAIKASSRQHEETRTHSARVIEWCEDSLELLDVLCELAGDRKAVVRRHGMKFFSWINYNRARALRSPIERIYFYFMIYKTFQYHYSPMRFYIFSNPYFQKARGLLKRANAWHTGLLGKSQSLGSK